MDDVADSVSVRLGAAFFQFANPDYKVIANKVDQPAQNLALSDILRSD
jgi:hypothetical protein